MEGIINSLNGPNGLLIALLLAFIAICIIIGAKHSLVKIHTERIDIGRQSSDNERKILRYQKDWVHLECMAFEEKVPHNFEGYDKWKARCVIERIYDEIVDWIMLNHIEDTERYVKLKQEIVWNIILTSTDHKVLRSNNFKKEVDAKIAQVITHLITIREQYSNNAGGKKK